MNLGETIARLRKEAGLSQKSLGEKLNVSFQAVSKWENGLSQPDLDMLNEIARVFNISLSELLGEDNSWREGKETKDETAKEPDNIGTCTVCGKFITAADAHATEPKIICKNCQSRKVAKEREAAIQKELERKSAESKRAAEIERYRIEKFSSVKRGLIVGAIVAAVVMIIFWISVTRKIDGKSAVDEGFWSCFGSSILITYVVFACVAQLLVSESALREVAEFFLGFVFKAPGIIFSLDFDGIVFLILAKIFFFLLGILLSALLVVVGFAVSILLGGFMFPAFLAKAIKERKTAMPPPPQMQQRNNLIM